jgi:membrane protein DedA with SNARE-associated domain
VEAVIVRYGLVAIFLGAGVEGEPFALAGGVLAHHHWLPLWAAMVAAIAGSCCIDQIWFHLSRNFRRSPLVQKVIARAAFRRSLDLIERQPARFVLLFRFAYGLRAVTAVAVGASRMPVARFVALNVVAAVLWGMGFTGLGYMVGPVIDRIQTHYGFAVTAGSIAVSALALALMLRSRS